MRTFTRSAMIITLFSISLMGCGNKTDQPENKQQPAQVQEQTENQENVTDEQSAFGANDNDLIKENIKMSDYFVSDRKAEINSTEDQITWKMGEVTFTAKKSSTSITSMQVNNDVGQYDISIPEEIKENKAELTSIALTPSNKFIAINIFITNVGNQLIVVDLTTGKSNTLNYLTNISYETIHTYNWSPSDNKLAFAYGDTSSSKLAIYDFDKQDLQRLSNNNLINTIFILWSKQGNDFDFISESPSDQFKLYRYTMGIDNAEEISQVSTDDLSNYNEFGPGQF